jgi:hypothetical protein
LSFAVLTGAEDAFYPSNLLYAALALIGGGALGSVLLGQRGVSVPSREKRGTSRGRSWDSRWEW